MSTKYLYNCVKFSSGQFGFNIELLHRIIELTYGVGDRPVGCFRATIHQLRETAADDTHMDLGQEQADADSLIGYLIAMGAGDLMYDPV